MVSGQFRLEIIFLGRSNVGKSTLFSELFGFKVRKGKKPGTTIEPNFFKVGDLLLTDMPGFGFMRGVKKEFNERVKDFIVKYIEENSKRIIFAVQVIDGSSFLDLAEKWEKKGEQPIDVEMFHFLNDFTEVIIAVNKIDRVKNEEETLNKIREKLVLDLNMETFSHENKAKGTKLRKEIVLLPVSAKFREISPLKSEMKRKLIEAKRHDLLKIFK